MKINFTKIKSSLKKIVTKKSYIIRFVIGVVAIILVYFLGVKPLLNGDYFSKAIRNDGFALGKLPKETGRFHVIVMGGEPEGVIAALSSARSGANTLLISESNNLDGEVSQCLNRNLEIDLGPKGDKLNNGIFCDILNDIKDDQTISKYHSVISSYVKNQDNLQVVYSANFQDIILKDGKIDGINAFVNGAKNTYYGGQFIDATRDGKLLTKLNIPYFAGSEDLNLANCFQPIRLNFLISGVNYSKLSNSVNKKGNTNFLIKLYNYYPRTSKMKLASINFLDQKDGTVIVEGFTLQNVNVINNDEINSLYKSAVKDTQEYINYLKSSLDEFKNAKWERAAENFYIREKFHFKGEYVLDVNDILENKEFVDKVGAAVYPVDASKFVDGGEGKYIIGKPYEYTIPVGCLIPKDTTNIMMVGNKISYSSIASTSAARLGTNISLAEASGIILVYCLINNISPKDLLKPENITKVKGLKLLLIKQGISVPAINVQNPNIKNWAYNEIKFLCSLGLISGGNNNDFQLDKDTTQTDLVYLLQNGIVRYCPNKFSLELDSSLNKYFSSDKLTKEKLGQILASLYAVNTDASKAFDQMCQLGHIDDIANQKIKDKAYISANDLFYIVALNLKQFAE